jgi:spermidine synthase
MRETLAAFHGDEMLLGIVLGNWLLLTGLGALAGRRLAGRRADAALTACLLLAALLPPALLFLLRAARHLLFAPGVVAGPAQQFFATLALLAPYCLAGGAFLTVAAATLTARRGPGGLARVYFADTLGAVIGGAAFTFILAARLDPFTLLGIVGLANLAAAALAAEARRPAPLAAIALAAALLIAFLCASPETRSARLQYAAEGQDFVTRARSPYGQLDVTRSGNQVNFLYNGLPLYSTGNRRQVEETVHFALHQRPRAERLLLIGGGVTGTAAELARRTGRPVRYVELDPLITDGRRDWAADTLPVACRPVLHTDGRLFLRRTTSQFDLILIDLPLPAGAQLNRFYSVEFFRLARGALAPGGALAFAAADCANYISPEQAAVLACLHRSLREVFPHVKVLPGERYHFLASVAPLHGDLRAWSAALNPPADCVRPAWIDAVMAPDRLADLQRALESPAPLNRDFDPALVRLLLRHRLTEHKVTFGALEAILLLALAFYLARLRPAPRAVLTIGFAAAALEFALLLGFQVLYGSLYRQLGLIVTLFMVGLAAGVALAGRAATPDPRRRLALTALATGAFALLLPAALALLNAPCLTGAVLPAAQAVIPLLTLALGALTGAAFPLAAAATAGDPARGAAEVFTADFIGAALGALLASMLLIPFIGLFWTCALTAALNLLSGALLFRRNGVV